MIGSEINSPFHPPYLVRTVGSVKVEKSRLLAADLGADSPDLVGMEVEEVEAAVVLVHRVVVVVAPEEVVAHLVALMTNQKLL